MQAGWQLSNPLHQSMCDKVRRQCASRVSSADEADWHSCLSLGVFSEHRQQNQGQGMGHAAIQAMRMCSLQVVACKSNECGRVKQSQSVCCTTLSGSNSGLGSDTVHTQVGQRLEWACTLAETQP